MSVTALHTAIDTPIGPFHVAMHDGVATTSFAWDDDLRDLDPAPDALVARLEAYFTAADDDFADIDLADTSSFTASCWEAARRIQCGDVRTYAELAAMAGSPRAARAVGGAMRANPAPIIVPCHRVVASNGGLGGFSGHMAPGGMQLRAKRWLLEHERR